MVDVTVTTTVVVIVVGDAATSVATTAEKDAAKATADAATTEARAAPTGVKATVPLDGNAPRLPPGPKFLVCGRSVRTVRLLWRPCLRFSARWPRKCSAAAYRAYGRP